MCAINDDFHAFQTQLIRKGRLAVFDVATGRIDNTARFTQLLRVDGLHGAVNHGLNLELQLIRELAALPVEKFDAVIEVRVMGGADHYARVRFLRSRQKGDPRGRQWTQQLHVRTRRYQSRLQC